jgi:hypothetical protein
MQGYVLLATQDQSKSLSADAALQTQKAQYMFQYFLKVVATQFRTLDGKKVSTHQYSATHFERDLQRGITDKNNAGINLQHGVSGLPGEHIPSP